MKYFYIQNFPKTQRTVSLSDLLIIEKDGKIFEEYIIATDFPDRIIHYTGTKVYSWEIWKRLDHSLAFSNRIKEITEKEYKILLVRWQIEGKIIHIGE